MTIYVDPENHYFPGHYAGFCHMVSDESIEELLEFAKKIGIETYRLQTPHKTPHFDLPPRFRQIAIQQGAVSVSRREMAKITLRLKGKKGRLR